MNTKEKAKRTGIVFIALLIIGGLVLMYKGNDALVLASRSEVQPLVLLEAMSTGIPVISTECVPKCLRVKEGSTIVPIGDAQALANAMCHIMNQPFTGGQQLSERIAAMASPTVVGKQLEKVFASLI